MTISKVVLYSMLLFGALCLFADKMPLLLKARSDISFDKAEYFTSDQWYMEVIPCNFLAEEGAEMAFLVGYDMIYSDGASWMPFKVDDKGDVEVVKVSRNYNKFCLNNSLWAKSWNLGKVEYNNKAPELYVRDTIFTWRDTKGKTQSICVDAYVQSDGHGGLVYKAAQQCELRKKFFSSDFQRYTKIYPDRYEGFGLIRKPNEVASARFRDVLSGKAQRDFIANITKSLDASSLFVIRFDANGDGLADLYVTTEKDKVDKDKYKWTLYLNRDGQMQPATEQIVMNGEMRILLQVLDPVEIASKDAFYRALHYYGEGLLKESIAIIDKDDEFGASHTCKKLLDCGDLLGHDEVEKNATLRGRGLEYWKLDMKEKYGFWPPEFVDELIHGSSLIMIERIKCEEFKPGSTHE